MGYVSESSNESTHLDNGLTDSFNIFIVGSVLIYFMDVPDYSCLM